MRPGRKPRRHDCGEHGWLTAREIAEHTGLTETTIHNRIARGIKGAALLAPHDRFASRARARTQWTDKGMHTAGTITLAVALRLVRMFPDHPPSVQQLQDKFGVCRATAYRWRAAWLDELGLAA